MDFVLTLGLAGGRYACVYFIIEGENLQHQLHRYPYFADWGRTDFMVPPCPRGVSLVLERSVPCPPERSVPCPPASQWLRQVVSANFKRNVSRLKEFCGTLDTFLRSETQRMWRFSRVIIKLTSRCVAR